MGTEQQSIDASASPEVLLRSWLRAFGLFRRTMEPHFAQFGITAAQWGVLHSLHRAHGNGMRELRMADLGQLLLIRPPSVTSVVRRSQQMGLLERRASTADHRARCIALTPKGRTMIRRVLSKHQEQVKSMFGCLSLDEQASLAASLDRLSMHLSGRLGSSGVPAALAGPIVSAMGRDGSREQSEEASREES